MIHFFGDSFLIQKIYSALMASSCTLLTYRYIDHLLLDKKKAFWCTLPVVFTTYVILPLPFYDNLQMLLGLVFLNLGQFLLARPSYFFSFFFLGFILITPAFVKQNTGVVYTLTFLMIYSWQILLTKSTLSKKKLTLFLSGFASSLSIISLFIYLNFGANYFNLLYQNLFEFPWYAKVHQSFFSRYSKLVFSANPLAFLVYWSCLLFLFKKYKDALSSQFKLTLALAPLIISLFLRPGNPFWGEALSFLNLWNIIIPLGAIVICIQLYKNKERLSEESLIFQFIPLISLPPIVYLSQGVKDSTYGIWPVFIITLAILIRFLKPSEKLVIGVSLLLSSNLGIYLYKKERYNYFFHQGQMEALKSDQWLQTPGPFFPFFDKLLDWTQKNIPMNQSVFYFTGEFPFYFKSQRVPPLPVHYLHPTTSPYPPNQLVEMSFKNNVEWLIVQTKFQSPVMTRALPSAKHTLNYYKRVQDLGGFVILQRRKDLKGQENESEPKQ